MFQTGGSASSSCTAAPLVVGLNNPFDRDEPGNHYLVFVLFFFFKCCIGIKYYLKYLVLIHFLTNNILKHL